MAGDIGLCAAAAPCVVALGPVVTGVPTPAAAVVAVSARGADAPGVDFAGAGALTASLPAYAARNFLATGASMLDDAPLTNSPNSESLATASLLVIPSSLAT